MVKIDDKVCEVCGSKIWGRSHRVRIEGVEMVACDNCADLGERIAPRRTQTRSPSRGTSYPASRAPSHSPRRANIPARSHAPRPRSPDENLRIVSGYGKKLIELRKSQKLNQEEFAQKLQVKSSLLQKWETEKIEPQIGQARKIEKMFGIKLLKKEEDISASLTSEEIRRFKSSGGTTMGDFIIRKKK